MAEHTVVLPQYGPWGERLGRPVRRGERVRLPSSTMAERANIVRWVTCGDCDLAENVKPAWWGEARKAAGPLPGPPNAAEADKPRYKIHEHQPTAGELRQGGDVIRLPDGTYKIINQRRPAVSPNLATRLQ